MGAWIEIGSFCNRSNRLPVAPLVGAWIEMDKITGGYYDGIVAPLVGAWIEISTLIPKALASAVAPLVGAWIEIGWWGVTGITSTSLPSWERGLKSHGGIKENLRRTRRSPRGSVD